MTQPPRHPQQSNGRASQTRASQPPRDMTAATASPRRPCQQGLPALPGGSHGNGSRPGISAPEWRNGNKINSNNHEDKLTVIQT